MELFELVIEILNSCGNIVTDDFGEDHWNYIEDIEAVVTAMFIVGNIPLNNEQKKLVINALLTAGTNNSYGDDDESHEIYLDRAEEVCVKTIKKIKGTKIALAILKNSFSDFDDFAKKPEDLSIYKFLVDN